MRPYIEDYEDFDDYAGEWTRAGRKLLDDRCREKRSNHQSRHRDRFKGRREHVDWDWNEDRDLGPHVDY